MRPWGPLAWLLERLPIVRSGFGLLGSVAAEERCLGVVIGHAALLQRATLLRIEDPPSHFSDRQKEKTDVHEQKAREVLGQRVVVPPRHLLAKDDDIASGLEEALSGGVQSLVLDITCLPKRYSFLLVKLALQHPGLRTVVVIYSQPAPGSYTDEHLAEDPQAVAALPGFSPAFGEQDTLVVAVGFEALGLPQLLGEYRDRQRDCVILLPFPPGQPYSRRLWQSIMAVGYPGESSVRRVSAGDAFGTATLLSAEWSGQGARSNSIVLAPYGPKPVSLGMCLHAIRHGCPVVYTQPLVYHPDYTTGIGTTWGYCLKLNSVELWRSATESVAATQLS